MYPRQKEHKNFKARLYLLDEQLNKIHIELKKDKPCVQLSEKSLAHCTDLAAKVQKLKPYQSCSITDRCIIVKNHCWVDETGDRFDCCPFLEEKPDETI